MKNITLSILFVIVAGLTLTAQTSTNIQLGLVNTFGDGSFRSIGVGGGMQKAFSGKFVIGLSANIYLGGKSNVTDTAFAINSNTTPSFVEVEVKRSVLSYTGSLDLKYYFVGDAEGDVGVYGLAGFGIMKMAVRVKEVGTYDASKYAFYSTPYVNDLSAGFAMGPVFGAGFEKNLGSKYFFTNARFFLPVSSEADPGIGFEMPKALVLEAGLRFPF